MEMKDKDKEKDQDKMRKIAEIVKQVWKVYDIFKKEGLGVDDSHLLLLFLSLYKDGQLEEFLDQLDKPDDNQTVGETAALYSNQKIDYLQVAASEKQFSEFSKQHISEQFAHLNKEDLLENYEGVFESVLQQITTSQGRVGGESMQPDELTQFIANLIDLPKGAKVYNPFAGYGSYAFYLNEDCEYFGQELNPKTWTLGKLRMKAHNKLKNTNYVCEDSILNWPKESEKFDFIVSTPPFDMFVNKDHKVVDAGTELIDHFLGKIVSVEHFVVEKGISSLNEKGKLIVLLPQRQEQTLREELVKKDLIDTIISLPGGLLPNTSIPLAVLVIDKDKKTPGKVRFIDAEKFVESKDLANKKLNHRELAKIIQRGYQDSESIIIVDNKEILASVYYRLHNLLIDNKLARKIEGVKLGDILEPIKGSKQNLPESGELIRIGDLKDDKFDFKLDFLKSEKIELDGQRVRLIDESCLLIASLFRSSKPTIFEFNDTPIYLSSDIYSFKINKKLVDPAYLINELHEKYVVRQFDSYRTGSVILRIKQTDLLDIVIKLPSLEVQKEKVLAEQSDKIKELQKERNLIAHSEATNQFNEFASLKHTLGRPRTNILAWADNINAFLTENKKEFESLNQEFKEFYGEDVFFALKNIKDEISFITKMLEKGEIGFNIEGHDITFISLLEIKELINSTSSNGVNFKIKRDLLIDITKKEELKSKGIDANKELFKALIDNVLTNADRYAFDEENESNEVIFELKEIDGFLVFEIRNNGKPFPRNYDREKFITKFSTTDFKKGTGQGGYHIHRIAKKFGNPNWKLILNEDPIYPVKFMFQFLIKNN